MSCLALAPGQLAGPFVGQWHPGAPWPPPATPRPAPTAWTTRNRLGLLLHGEVHNTAELARALGLPRETPLADVMFAGWQRWERGLLARLDGVFALAWHEGEALLLHRDPSGLKHLYLHQGVGGVASFGTALDRLARLPGVAPRLSHAALHEYLRFGDISAPRTVYDGILALEPGQTLRLSARGLERLASRPPEPSTPPPGDFDAAVNHLDALLSHGIAARLADLARPAAFLSGGVDSALVCAIGARQRPDLTAVTVGFEGAAFDESPAAARIARQLGLRHEVLRFDRAACLAAWRQLATAEQPVADPAGAVTVAAFAHCRVRFDAVLDGTGADEAAGLMPPRHVRLAVEYTSRLPGPVRAGLSTALKASEFWAGHAPLFDFEHPAETAIRWRGFKRAEIEGLCGEPVSFEDTHFYRSFARFPRHAHFERGSALLDAMPSERLTQASLLTGLVLRYPYCDAETNRFMRGLDVAHRFQPGNPKRILHALLARYLGPARAATPKHGFDFPLQAFLSADDHAVLREHLDEGVWRRHGLLSPGRVREYAQRYIAGEHALGFRVWQLVQLGAWLAVPERPIGD